MQISELGLHDGLIEQLIEPGIDMIDESIQGGRMQLLNHGDQTSNVVGG